MCEQCKQEIISGRSALPICPKKQNSDVKAIVMRKLRRTCGNCFDFDKEKNHCLIRYTILEDKTRIPMKRKAGQKGCQVFMYA